MMSGGAGAQIAAAGARRQALLAPMIGELNFQRPRDAATNATESTP